MIRKFPPIGYCVTIHKCMQKSMDHVPTKISDDAMLQSLNDFGDEQPWAASVIHAYERGIKIGYTNSLGKHLTLCSL